MEFYVQIKIFFVIPDIQMLKQGVIIQQGTLVKPLLIFDGRNGFQESADLVHLINLKFGDGTGKGSFPGTDFNQSFFLQGQKRFPDRSPADAGLFHDFQFIDGFPGHILTHFQLVPDMLVSFFL